MSPRQRVFHQHRKFMSHGTRAGHNMSSAIPHGDSYNTGSFKHVALTFSMMMMSQMLMLPALTFSLMMMPHLSR